MNLKDCGRCPGTEKTVAEIYTFDTMVANVVSRPSAEPRMRYFSYIVECSNGSFYAGWTSDLVKRLEQHNSGKGAKYTRALRPVTLKASWEFPSKSEAMSHEWHIKQMSRPDKMRLIADGKTL